MSSEHGLNIQHLPSEFGGDQERDVNTIDTIVIHTMYNPESETPYSSEACKAILDKYQVSSHYLIDREGNVYQLVPEEKQAWHAGASQMPQPDGRTGVNSFSIGVEIINKEDDELTDSQYRSLALLSGEIIKRRSITHIVGHSDIAPERKTDPWNFNWGKFKSDLEDILKDINNINIAH